MNKVHIMTVVVLAAALGMLAVRGRTRAAPREPQDVVYAMLDAARAGDVPTYLASYTGPMEASLRQTLAETTEAAFSKYLRDSNATVKGIAVSEPQKISDTQAAVRVEYVYQDRNEAQMMYLERGPDGWKISGTDSDHRIKTLIPYGTPVK